MNRLGWCLAIAACSGSEEAPAPDKPVDKTIDKPIDKPVDKPIDKPIDKPVVAAKPAELVDAGAEPPDAAVDTPPDPPNKRLPAKPAQGSGSGEIKRGFEPQVIRKVVMANLDAIRTCFTDQLAKRPNLDGHIGVTFVVGEDGKVIKATTPIGDDVVGGCINALILKARFPPPPGGGTVTINYPFEFSAAE